MTHTAYFERFTIELTEDQANSASHQGRCDRDVEMLCRDPAISAQLDAIGHEAIAEELKEYGAWDRRELMHQEDNRRRIVWCAACNIREDIYRMQSETDRADAQGAQP